MKRIAAASLAGLVAITIYIIVSANLRGHVPLLDAFEQLLQWDASNGFGDSAYAGGWTMATIGLAMDVVVSTVWAALFVMLYDKVAAVRRAPLPSGLVFGVGVMIVMIYMLVPLGHAHPPKPSVVGILNTTIAHALFFGLPIGWVVSRSSTA